MTEPPWLADAVRRVRGLAVRLPHALLIQGPGGWGEERVAAALAADIMGLPTGSTVHDVAHPDLRWLTPEDGVIKIDAVRALIDFLMQTPQLAGRKIAVVASAERMNLNAANALLKTLEEPPPESFVALVTGAPERLLPTVRSRCQRIAVHPLPPAEVHAWLVQADADPQQASHLAVEYGAAPYAVLEAIKRKQEPLWPTLAKAGRSPAESRDLAQAHRDADLADLAGRWLRIVHWLARRSPAHSIAPILDFATTLTNMRRIALFNTGLNRPMQLHRLLLLWAEIWPLLPAGAVPRLE